MYTSSRVCRPAGSSANDIIDMNAAYAQSIRASQFLTQQDHHNAFQKSLHAISPDSSTQFAVNHLLELERLRRSQYQAFNSHTSSGNTATTPGQELHHQLNDIQLSNQVN